MFLMMTSKTVALSDQCNHLVLMVDALWGGFLGTEHAQ